MDKRLYRSRINKKFLGVCGGIAEYFDADPTIIRVLWIIFACAGGSGILAYFIAAFIMPEQII